MSDETIHVTIHVGPGVTVDHDVPRGTTVIQLKERLAASDPTGSTRADSFSLASLSKVSEQLDDGAEITSALQPLVVGEPAKQKAEADAVVPVAPAMPPAKVAPVPPTIEPGEPCEYRVMQGPLMKKPGRDPTSPKVIKVTRKVGSTVKTTGRTWRGPSGGLWVELDPAAEKAGWLLIEGPGFDLPGPLLQIVDSNEEAPIVLSVFSVVAQKMLCDICVKPSDTTRVLQRWIALRAPGNHLPKKIWCTNNTPEQSRASKFLRGLTPLTAETKIGEAGFKDGGNVCYVVTGNQGEIVGLDDVTMAGEDD